VASPYTAYLHVPVTCRVGSHCTGAGCRNGWSGWARAVSRIAPARRPTRLLAIGRDHACHSE
jgi:hypothetical protein